MLTRAAAVLLVVLAALVAEGPARAQQGSGAEEGSGSAPDMASGSGSDVRRIVEQPMPAAVDHVVVEPAPARGAKSSDDDDGVVRLSLPTQADRTAWMQPGFRLGLGLVYGRMEGLRGAPSGRLLGPMLHAGLRLDKDWSIYASFEYASASQTKGLSGLRFAGTIDPTWHVTPSLALAFGFGFAGIVEGRTGRPDPEPLPGSVTTGYTFPSSEHPLPSCSGVGAAGLVRGTYSYVMGPRATFNAEVEVFGQYTACVDRTGRVEDDTAQPIVREQYWPHLGMSLGAGFAWR